jgi:hypothetical protein
VAQTLPVNGFILFLLYFLLICGVQRPAGHGHGILQPGEAAGQEGRDGLLRYGLPGQLQDPHDLSQGERGGGKLLDRNDVTDSYVTAYLKGESVAENEQIHT